MKKFIWLMALKLGDPRTGAVSSQHLSGAFSLHHSTQQEHTARQQGKHASSGLSSSPHKSHKCHNGGSSFMPASDANYLPDPTAKFIPDTQFWRSGF